MPELPEVETIRRDLVSAATGKRIAGVRILPDPRGARLLRRYPSATKFVRRLRGRKIKTIRRRGKYLLFDLDSGDVLIVHLGMSGQLLRRPAGAGPDRFARAVFRLSDDSQIRFCDSRKFGEMYIFSRAAGDTRIDPEKLGPEPLADGFTAAALAAALGKRKKPVKALLLDQSAVAGIGNIYSDEILFAGGIHPERPAGSLRAKEIERLHRAMKTILRRALRYRGTSAADEKYVDARGRKGNFQRRLKVYQRGGESCRVCRRPLRTVRLQGRTAHFCPRCQR